MEKARRHSSHRAFVQVSQLPLGKHTSEEWNFKAILEHTYLESVLYNNTPIDSEHLPPIPHGLIN
jgi:hypothetical protein